MSNLLEMNTQKMSVDEIRQYIITTYNISKDVVDNIKGKTKLVNFMLSLENSEEPKKKEDYNMFEFNLTTENNDQISTNNSDKVPSITDPEWTDYILNQLTDDEKSDGYPKVDGLRRLVEKNIGPIVGIYTNIIQCPQNGNNMTSTVKSTIRIGLGLDNHYKNFIEYEACTDVQKDDCPSPYNKHISAVAETRAEGRAYRKILRLQNVVTQEEMAANDISNIYDNSKINATQIAFLDNMSRNDHLNINVIKFLKMLFPNITINSVRDYLASDITKAGETLSDYQADISKIPQEIRGYDPSWKL